VAAAPQTRPADLDTGRVKVSLMTARRLSGAQKPVSWKLRKGGTELFSDIKRLQADGYEAGGSYLAQALGHVDVAEIDVLFELVLEST
jgi:hypothetical protein